MLDGLKLILRYAEAKTTFYPRGETVALDGVLKEDWREFAVTADHRGRPRVVRHVYECCVLIALRDRLRCKEIWVVGADKWRNPDDDLPADFEAKRAAPSGPRTTTSWAYRWTPPRSRRQSRPR